MSKRRSTIIGDGLATSAASRRASTLSNAPHGSVRFTAGVLKDLPGDDLDRDELNYTTSSVGGEATSAVNAADSRRKSGKLRKGTGDDTPDTFDLQSKPTEYECTRLTVAPSSLAAQNDRCLSRVWKRNQEENIDMVRRRASSLALMKQAEAEERAKEKEVKLAKAEEGRSDRMRRELINIQRTSLWLQCFCAVSPINFFSELVNRQFAIVTLRTLLGPMLKLRRHRRARAKERSQLLLQRSGNLVPLDIADLKGLTFFSEWNSCTLQLVLNAMQPECFRKGNVVFQKGEVLDDAYILTHGAVEVTSDTVGVRQKRKERVLLGTITSGTPESIFGEFAAVFDETRCATVTAAVDCDTWRIPGDVLRGALGGLLESERACSLNLVKSRRMRNIPKLFPLEPEDLVASGPTFACWRERELRQVISCFTPTVAPPLTPLFSEGQPGDCLYLVVSGKVVLRKAVADPPGDDDGSRGKRVMFPSHPPPSPQSPASPNTPSSSYHAFDNTISMLPPLPGLRSEQPSIAGTVRSLTGEASRTPLDSAHDLVGDVVGPGEVVGEIALVFLECRSYSAAALTACDMYMLTRNDLSTFLMSNPDWFVKAKMELNPSRAKWLQYTPCPLDPWKQNALFARLASPIINTLPSLLTPSIIDRSNLLVEAGGECEHIICITRGSVVEVKSDKEYSSGTLLGVAEVITGQPKWEKSIKAQTRCDCWLLKRSVLFQLLSKASPAAIKKLNDETFLNEVCKEYGLSPQPRSRIQALLNQAMLHSQPPAPSLAINTQTDSRPLNDPTFPTIDPSRERRKSIGRRRSKTQDTLAGSTFPSAQEFPKLPPPRRGSAIARGEG